MTILKYFKGYPEDLISKVSLLVDSNNLKSYLLNKYPNGHSIKSDKLLFEFTNSFKVEFLKKAPPLSKVIYEKQKDIIQNSLGNHTFISRSHGGKLKSKHEIRVSSVLKEAPEEMLTMLVVHELAHIKEKNHDRNFISIREYFTMDIF